jgi:hypothetical protein
MPAPSRARLIGLFAYAAAMGWLEGVVVVYIRSIVGIAYGEGVPAEAVVMQRMRSLPWLLGVEQSREAATLVMLAAVAWIAARGWRGRLGALLICFGTWDIVYYVALSIMVGWPTSLITMDLLFLIPPHPLWYQPVWLPVAISAVMIAAGVVLFLRAAAPEPRTV